MELHESGEMYLESILILAKKQNAVRSIDIVDYMGFSKPSVSRAVGKLKADKLIIVDSDGYIALTENGRQIAESIYQKHTKLTEFFMALGVDEDTASRDACCIEHVISDETFNAIVAHVAQIPE